LHQYIVYFPSKGLRLHLQLRSGHLNSWDRAATQHFCQQPCSDLIFKIKSWACCRAGGDDLPCRPIFYVWLLGSCSLVHTYLCLKGQFTEKGKLLRLTTNTVSAISVSAVQSKRFSTQPATSKPLTDRHSYLAIPF
jgi:hypothetical protein